MRSCVHCGNHEFRKTTETLSAAFPVSGVTASVAVAGEQCTKCRETLVPPSVVQEFELAVACELAGRGVCTGEAVRHMRKVLGLRAADLARLLDLRARSTGSPSARAAATSRPGKSSSATISASWSASPAVRGAQACGWTTSSRRATWA